MPLTAVIYGQCPHWPSHSLLSGFCIASQSTRQRAPIRQSQKPSRRDWRIVQHDLGPVAPCRSGHWYRAGLLPITPIRHFTLIRAPSECLRTTSGPGIQEPVVSSAPRTQLATLPFSVPVAAPLSLRNYERLESVALDIFCAQSNLQKSRDSGTPRASVPASCRG